MSKQCRACTRVLPLEDFNKDAATKDGFRARCKVCDKERRPIVIKAERDKMTEEERFESHKTGCKKYEKTKNGFLMRAYRNMKSRVEGIQKLKSHLYEGLPILPKEEFYAWALADRQFNLLFDAWQHADYARPLSPSVDRIDSTKGYVEGNIRWLTHSKNSSLGSLARSASQTSTSTNTQSDWLPPLLIKR